MRCPAHFVRAALLAATFVTASVGAQPPSGPPPALVVTDAARAETVDQWREVTGELRSLRRSTLASRQEGLVSELLVDDGGAVEAGQVIAKLDDTLAKIQVRRAEADVVAKRSMVAMRRTELDRAKRDVERYGKLDRPDSVSATELDQTRSRAAMMESQDAQAAAELASAEADLASAQERLAQMTIVAPFKGRVVKKLTEVGQWLQFGGGVAEVIALDELEARLDIPEETAAALVGGSSSARVRVRALGIEKTGPIELVLPEADARTRLVGVRVRLENQDLRLRPGMSITGLVSTGKAAASITVHKDAVLRDDAGEYVWWNAGGVAMVARVRTLFAVGDRVAISAQLPPNAAVIVKGNERIMFPGQPVMDANSPPPGAGPKGEPEKQSGPAHGESPKPDGSTGK